MTEVKSAQRRSGSRRPSQLAETVERVSCISLPDVAEVNRGGVITNRIPAVILPEEIPTARLILRRDRLMHFEELGAVLDWMQLREKGHDCVIVCGSHKINAHRCVLAAHSQYFHKILFQNGGNSMVDVPADGIPAAAMMAIVHFMYTGDLKVNFQNALDTLTTANVLQMEKLSENCSHFIDTLLADENLMSTLQLAERTGIDPLYAEAYKRLAKNFYIQTKMPAFLLWDIEKVLRLLSNDHILIETEMHVFTAAMRWMQFKKAERWQFFRRLMDCIRWVYMSAEEILSCIDQESDLLKESDIRILLIDANWYVTLQSYNFTWKDYFIPLPRIAALRKEDPETVVQRMRISLVAKHSSFDQIWRSKEPSSNFGKKKTSTVRKSVSKTNTPADEDSAILKSGSRKSKPLSPRDALVVDPAGPRLKSEKLPQEEFDRKNSPRAVEIARSTSRKPSHGPNGKSPLAERFSLFRKVTKTVRRKGKSNPTADESHVGKR